MKQIPMVGKKFGNLTVVEDAGKSKGHQRWKCRCSCGNDAIVDGGNLRSGHTKSCGHCEKYEQIDDVTMICLLPNSKSFLFDVKDYDIVREHRWSLDELGYVQTMNGRKKVRLHRVLFNNPEGMQIDHINGDRSDNRRLNLRIVNNQQNHWNNGINSNNSSGYKGVSFDKRRLKYYAHITKNGRGKFLGYYDNPIEAAMAYDRAAIKFFGEYAKPNFGEGGIYGEVLEMESA